MKQTRPGIPQGQALDFTRIFVSRDRPARHAPRVISKGQVIGLGMTATVISRDLIFKT